VRAEAGTARDESARPRARPRVPLARVRGVWQRTARGTMPKALCVCGYVHELSAIPDEGWVLVRDRDYERLLEAEIARLELRTAKPGTPEWDALMAADATVESATQRMYECPECGRLLWLRTHDASGKLYSPD
jgi:hypothetical protein